MGGGVAGRRRDGAGNGSFFSWSFVFWRRLGALIQTQRHSRKAAALKPPARSSDSSQPLHSAVAGFVSGRPKLLFFFFLITNTGRVQRVATSSEEMPTGSEFSIVFHKLQLQRLLSAEPDAPPITV